MCKIFCYQWKASWLVTLFFKWETLIELILFNFIFKKFKLLKKIKSRSIQINLTKLILMVESIFYIFIKWEWIIFLFSFKPKNTLFFFLIQNNLIPSVAQNSHFSLNFKNEIKYFKLINSIKFSNHNFGSEKNKKRKKK